jgi:outer membrane lipoprotein SlyB
MLLSGCTFPSAGPMVSQSQVGVAKTLAMGRIVSSEPVGISGQKTNLGQMGGAGVGGIAASGGRYDTGGLIAGAVGAVAGAVVGQAVEEVATREEGQRLIIQMDDGRMIEIVQTAKDGYFREGDRVQVAEGGAESTVSMATGIDMKIPVAEPAWYEVTQKP